jgi:glycosyltransferase involved in cell wall biosynthesis
LRLAALARRGLHQFAGEGGDGLRHPGDRRRQHGVQDLIDGDNCVALRRQGPVAGFGDWETAGWGESDVEEIVAGLERLYADAAQRRRIGLRGAEWILAQGRTWQEHARQLKELVLSL